MFGSAVAADEGYGPGVSSAQPLVSEPAIGKLQTVMGLVTITRANMVVAQPTVGDFVYEGDLIETGIDGQLAIAFVDGTTFQLYADARLVLDEFICSAEKSSNSALLRVVTGVFSFIAGKMATTGRLIIDTPLGQIRSTGPAAGIGSLVFGVLTLGLIRELQAATTNAGFVDDGTIDYREYYESLPHGGFTIHTKGDHPQDITVDKTTETIILELRGSGISVQQLTNTPTEMALLHDDYLGAHGVWSQGQLDSLIQHWQHADVGPQSTGSTGSSTSASILSFNPPTTTTNQQQAANDSAPHTTPLPSPTVTAPPIILVIPPPPPPPATAWSGDTLIERYFYPSFGANYYTSPTFVAPATGIEGNPDRGGAFFLSVDANSITASGFTFTDGFASGSFNGFEVADVSGDPLISGVTIDPTTNMAGLTSSDVSFDSKDVWINWAGLNFDPSTIVKLDVTFDPPLNPAQVHLASTLDGSTSPANNAATLTVVDGTELALTGSINNSGTIVVDGSSAATAIGIDGHVTLHGGGQIDLSDSNENYIFGNAGATLTNLDNTISGSGDIGNGSLVFDNAGVIETHGSSALIIDTGLNVFVNTGKLETDGGSLIVDSPVTGGGSAVIAGGTLEFFHASDNNVSFSGDGAGMLALDQSQSFTGHISGFGSQDQIDLGDITFSTKTTLSFTADSDGTGGTLTVSDGLHTAALDMLGNYTAASFVTSTDGHGGTMVDEASITTADQGGSIITNTAAGQSAAATADGTVTFVNVDSSDTATASFTPNDAGYAGTFSLDPVSQSNGSASVGWEFSLAHDQINLVPGETSTQSYGVNVTEAHGSTMSQTVAVSIGGASDDNFVFHPGLGADTIVNFNPQSDSIELNGFSNIQSEQQLASLITNDAHGDAELNLGHNDSVTLPGMTAAELHAVLQTAVHLH